MESRRRDFVIAVSGYWQRTVLPAFGADPPELDIAEEHGPTLDSDEIDALIDDLQGTET